MSTSHHATGNVQVGVQIYSLIGGHFYLPHKEVFQDALDSNIGTGDTVPTFSFLIDHPTRGKYLFDLGLRKHGEGYPPAWNETLAEFKPTCDKDVSDILKDNNIDPKSIQGVIFSHLHFDHTGDVEPFSSAEIILGGEAESLFETTYPSDPESPFYDWPKGRSVRYINFESNQSTLSDNSSSLPQSPFFQRSYDLFSDGSLLLVDAPGHFPGHLAALARVGTTAGEDIEAEDVYLLLAGDCCHNRQCYMTPPLTDQERSGIREISEANHDNIKAARRTMSLLVRIEQDMPDVVIILAHEKELESTEGGMPFLPNSLNKWVAERVKSKRTKK